MSEKIAVITGGTGYLGREVVNSFSLNGYKVYIPVRSIAKFTEIIDNETKEIDAFILRKIFAFECDVLNEESVKHFLQKVLALEKNRIDVLVNAVGGFPSKPFLLGDLSEEEFDSWYNINFKSAFFFTSGVLNSMKENEFGRILSIGSVAGIETMYGRFAYSLSKASLMTLMDAVSREYKDYGIFASTVIPSVIDTPSNREWGSDDDIKKWVSAKEIAEVILRIVSDEFKPVRQPFYKIYGNY